MITGAYAICVKLPQWSVWACNSAVEWLIPDQLVAGSIPVSPRISLHVAKNFWRGSHPRYIHAAWMQIFFARYFWYDTVRLHHRHKKPSRKICVCASLWDVQRCIQHADLGSFTWSADAVIFARLCAKNFPRIFACRMRHRQSLTYGEQKIRGIISMQCVKSRDVQCAQCSKVCIHIYMRQTQQTFMRLCMNNYPCLCAARQKSNCLPYNTQNVNWFLHSICMKRSVRFVRRYNVCIGYAEMHTARCSEVFYMKRWGSALC